MKKVIRSFDSLMQNYLPDPFVIAVILTYIIFVLALFCTNSTAVDISLYWGKGMWDLLAFMTQMALVLLGGFVVASSLPVKSLLQKVSALPKTSHQVVLTTFLLSVLLCWLNWGLGLVASAFIALEMAKRHKNVSYRLLVATSYMGFLFWHGGLSGSIPLVVNTPGNFSEKWLGQLIPIQKTLFSQLNIVLIFGLIICLSLLVLFLNSKAEDDVTLVLDEKLNPSEEGEVESLSEKMDRSKMVNFVVLSLGVAYIFALIIKGQWNFDLNMVNLLLILFALLLYPNSKSFMSAVNEGSRRVGPILVQYPLYAGIMGVIVETGLASQISQFFVDISTTQTYPLFTFLSAGLINFFVPSGGGQWAVQAPIVIEGAKSLGVPLEKAVMAVAWGDAWTNLAQPFWALPLLSIAGLGAKDIMGYCLFALLVSGTYSAIVFLIL